MSYADNLFFGASPEIHKRARELRKRLTPSEKILWETLKGKSFRGLKFRRQHPIHKFIVDFYCHELKLVIEIDGGIHDTMDQKEYDMGRTFELNELGLEILRFGNEMILSDIQLTLIEISKFIDSHQA
ncbi:MULTISPECIES: endonuclease domain-containing protein [Rhodonellum]|nr:MULTISPECIES: endonuclease domain-containing protein [Rhodonellum]SDZ55159.1 Very-short-patch-repair endonuclease [Rhodonellum ikkaensis]